MKKQDTVKSKNIITITTIAILIVLIGVTYAALEYQREGTKENIISTRMLKIALQAGSNGLNINPAVPLSEDQGLEQAQGYKFVLNNTGTANASYRIKLVDDEEEYTKDKCTDNKLNHNYIKASITKDGVEQEPVLLGENDDIIDKGTIKAGEESEYTLKIWIDDSADTSVGGAHFHGKIKLEGIVEGRTNYETGE